MKTHSLLALLLALSPALRPVLSAQSPEPAEQSFELRLLAWTPIKPNLTFHNGGEVRPLYLSTNRFDLHEFKERPKRVEIHTTFTDAEGNTLETVYAAADWPADSKDIIGFLQPNPDTEGQLFPSGQVLLFRDKTGLHPEHTIRFINFTPVVLAIRGGQDKTTLRPQEDLIVPFDPSTGRVRLDILAQEHESGEWRQLMNANIPTGKDRRAFAFIRRPANPEPNQPVPKAGLTVILERSKEALARPRAPLPISEDPDAI
ncbi:MAG: hypothetical protein ACFCU4_07870 [Puniceicoccaceae bacterium]